MKLCMKKLMYNIFLDVLLYPGHDQVSLNATVACNPQLCKFFRDLHLGIYATCTYKCNLKVAQINLSIYVCHCTLVGSLLVLIQINRGFVRSHQKENVCKSNMTKGQLTTQCTSIYQPSGSCRSAQQLLASSLSFYLRMYICTLSKSQVSEALHVAQFSLHTRRQSCYYL